MRDERRVVTAYGRRYLSAADALEKLRPIHRRILERRQGEPLDVDAMLGELRSGEAERQPSTP
jgi:hypothetical protein